MLTDFTQIFIDIYEYFIDPDFPLKEYFESIIVLVVFVCSICGSILFGAVALNAVFSVFKSK